MVDTFVPPFWRLHFLKIIMVVYKFQGLFSDLEVHENSFSTIYLSVIKDDVSSGIELTENQLYDLIGVLHSIKGKLDKYKKEGKNG